MKKNIISILLSMMTIGISNSQITVVNGSSLISTGLNSTDFNPPAVANSNFFGASAGNGSTNASYSNFLGNSAGAFATNALNSNFLGNQAGYGATGASYSNFFGNNAGNSATDASGSNFLGQYAGSNATTAYYSNFFGGYAGLGATNAHGSTFLGSFAGYSATRASYSNFLGYMTGYNATNSYNSNFLGYMAGYNATNAYNSIFVGYQTGNNATNASYSTLIGFNVGFENNSSSHIGANNIIIGTNITLPPNTTNSMNLGGVLFGNGFYSTVSGDPSSTPVSGGKIGIGIINPSTTLDIEDNADYQLRLGNKGGNGYNIGRNGTTGYLTFYGDHSTHTGYTFGGADGARMTIDNNGKVGIGTTNPRGNLEVFGNNITPKVALRFTGSDQYASNYIQSDTDGHYLEFSTFGTSYSNPLFGLSLAGSTAIIMAPKTTGKGFFGTTTAAPLVFGTNNIERMRIDTSGNIGIGCFPGSSPLKVYKSELPTIELASSVSRLQIGMATSPDCFATGAVSGDAVIRTLGANNSTILSIPNNINDGKSFIGFQDEANGIWVKICNNKTMRVNGTIIASEILVKADVWADYVFKPTYKLMPLPEVEQFVKTNNHLPQVPSANEVSKNGISVSEMQNKLLQKVEELTLYAIQQDKSKKELERKYNALLEKVEMLTKQMEKK